MIKIGVLLTLLTLIIIVDKVFFSKSARNAWVLMTFTYVLGASLIIENSLIESITHFLGIGRPVDVIIYIVVVLFVREFFVSRFRFQMLQKQITDITRAEAIRNVIIVKKAVSK